MSERPTAQRVIDIIGHYKDMLEGWVPNERLTEERLAEIDSLLTILLAGSVGGATPRPESPDDICFGCLHSRRKHNKNCTDCKCQEFTKNTWSAGGDTTRHIEELREERNGFWYIRCLCGHEVGPYWNVDYACDDFDNHAAKAKKLHAGEGGDTTVPSPSDGFMEWFTNEFVDNTPTEEIRQKVYEHVNRVLELLKADATREAAELRERVRELETQKSQMAQTLTAQYRQLLAAESRAAELHQELAKLKGEKA